MKRADAKKAVDDAFTTTLALEYSNSLIFNLALDRPDRPAMDEKFRRMLANNIEAYGMAMKAVAENKDLED
jgi:hypothetical protein